MQEEKSTVFKDREVQYPNRYTITKFNQDGSSESIVANIVGDHGTIIQEGTPINAETLNSALNEKQDKLIAGAGIEIKDNTISALVPLNGFGYEHIAQDIIPRFNSIVDMTNWSAVPSSTSFNYGEAYVYDVENSMIKYCDFSVDFEVSDVYYNVNIDADPTIIVRIKNEEGNYIVCQYAFVKNRAVLRKGSNWSEYFAVSDVHSNVTNGFCKMRVCRKNKNDGSSVYQIYLDNVLVLEQNITDNYNHSAIQIGTIGCKATIKYWKVDGTF